ncbi:MAG: hypothetical protein R2702_16600 [Acidimicrobiales bacterium]
MALLDGEWVDARLVATPEELERGDLRLEGCGPVELTAGEHDLLTIFGWRLDEVRFSSPGSGSATSAPADAGTPTVRSRTATEVAIDVPASEATSRVLRLGEAWDPRWTLEVDGVDAGEPMVVDGYSSGWVLDGEAHRLVVRFGPQQAVRVTFVASSLALVGVTALAVLPPVLPARRRRRPGRASGPAGTAGGAP